ncbi:anti-sigma factor [Spongorhabdus nitratireducens]
MYDKIDLTQAEIRDQAAAEYVLGTLDGDDKLAFEALLSVSHDAQALVEEWRERLSVLQMEVADVVPPRRVWAGIKKQTKSSSGFFESLMFWRGLAVSMVFVMAMGLVMTLGRNETENMDYVYVAQNQAANPGWIVNASMDSGKVFMKAVQPDELPEGKVCELWLMVKDGEPVSLGILPKYGTKEFVLSASMMKHFAATPLVITLEDPSGAPDGWNMGPVVEKGGWTPVSNRRVF